MGAYYSVQLYKNLRTDVEELLPTDARSVVDLAQVTGRLQAIENLAVLVFSEDAKASKRFVDDLANELSEMPKELVANVEYRIDREIAFFQNRAALFMETPDLIRIRDYIQARLKFERELYNPLNFLRDERFNLKEPHFDFEAIRRKYVSKTSSYDRFPGGYYATPDGKKRAVLVYMRGKGSSIDRIHELKRGVEAAVARLKPESYAPDLKIQYTGGIQDTIEEHSALISDLGVTSVIVILFVTAAMLVFFRTVAGTFALMASLFLGVFWTFGISYFAVGYLNANSAFLGSIIIGNGINFGIILLARYLEERRKGRANAGAVYRALAYTSTATWAAALAAGLSYGSLVLTGFRGFRQFGVIGLIGMVLCWIAAFTLLPAYLTLLDRLRPIVRRGSVAPRSYFAAGTAWLVSRYPRPIWLGALTMTAISLALILTRIGPSVIETDLTRLRNKESLEHGSAYLSRHVDEIFQRYLSPIAILPATRDNALLISSRLKEVQSTVGPSSLIASVQTIDDFVPRDQAAKVGLLQEIRRLLPERILAHLSDSDQSKVRELLRPQGLRTFTIDDLPELVRLKFTEQDGSLGKMVLVEPPLTNETREGEALIRFIARLREAADSVAPGTPVAGTLPISSDMIQAISRDGPMATLIAFIAVTLMVILLFRSVGVSFLILSSLLMGVIGLGGFMMALGLKINFLNFIALPITFGIGVDYGVNIFERWREEGSRDILSVIRNTGGAVGLCSFTTMVGYSSLLLAGNLGFVSFGRLAVAGELTCLFAAILAFPALLVLRERAKA